MNTIRVLIAFITGVVLTLQGFAQPAFEPSGAYLRTGLDGDVVKLDVATKILVPIKGDGPTLTLVGAIHVADPGFYALTQRLMDGHDLVLFEGVGGPSAEAIEPGSDADKARVTKRRLKSLAMACLAFHDMHERWPESRDQMLAGDSGLSTIDRRLVHATEVDGWGNPITLGLTNAAEEHGQLEMGNTLVSLGSDGEHDGEGHAADLVVTTSQIAEELNSIIHVRLANILGLVFQGQHILTDQPHWQNSDMRMDEVAEALKERGSGAGEMLDELLGGENPMFAQMLAGFENLATASPMINTMFKLTVVTQLSKPDAIGDQVDSAMHEVVIELRNQVVVDDLKAILGDDAEQTPETIAVFYGAGHMADFEERLFEQLGYRVAGTMWFNAISLDLTQQGLSDAELNTVRQQVQRWVEE